MKSFFTLSSSSGNEIYEAHNTYIHTFFTQFYHIMKRYRLHLFEFFLNPWQCEKIAQELCMFKTAQIMMPINRQLAVANIIEESYIWPAWPEYIFTYAYVPKHNSLTSSSKAANLVYLNFFNQRKENVWKWRVFKTSQTTVSINR